MCAVAEKRKTAVGINSETEGISTKLMLGLIMILFL